MKDFFRDNLLPNSKALSKSFINKFSFIFSTPFIHRIRYAHTLFQVFMILKFLLAVFALCHKPVHAKFLFVRHAIVDNVIITLATLWTYRLIGMSHINCPPVTHIITFIKGTVNTVAAKIAGAKTVSVFKYVFSLMPFTTPYKKAITLDRNSNKTILSAK